MSKGLLNRDLKLKPENWVWLKTPGLQRVFDVLNIEGEETRVNGGAVRNSILGETIGDVDLSTTLLPDMVLQHLGDGGIKAIATGLSHGTITAIVDKKPYEITTLRSDIATDGRHATVAFGRSWSEDACRRDLTMNALYCDRGGKIFDPLTGYDDLISRRVRFIGDAGQRIEEDYLRILRFFRFFAQYGQGRPDGEGLKACARLKDGMAKLSVERVWMELKKILSVKDPSRALLWMRTTGVLTKALPESEKWGIDFIGDMMAAEQDLDWPIDVLARLQVMVPPLEDKMLGLANRLRLSKSEKKRLIAWTQVKLPSGNTGKRLLGEILYYGQPQAICDRIRNEIVRQRHIAREQETALVEAANYLNLYEQALSWRRPVFPIKGQDLVNVGKATGPDMGDILRKLERKWVESGFSLKRGELLAQV